MDVAARLLNGLLMIALPLLLGIFLVRRTGERWRLFLAGAVIFVGAQVLHIPFNQFILNPILQQLGFGDSPSGSGLLIGALLLGLSAGLFEEAARYLSLRYWQQRARSWNSALMFGAGWGGAEAILLGGLTLFAFFQALAYQQADLSQLVPAGQLEAAEAQLSAYWAVPWPVSLLGAVERAFALVIQLSLTVLVMQVFLRGRLVWLIAAIAWHTLVDAVAVVGLFQFGAVVTEGLVGFMALISLGIIFWLKDNRGVPRPEAESGGLQEIKPVKLQVTDEDIEGSRYAD